MTNHSDTIHRLIAIDLVSRGFGYGVLESRDELVDWGLKETRTEKYPRTMSLVRGLLVRFSPDLIVVEDCIGPGTHRSWRIRDLVGAILQTAWEEGYRTKAVLPSDVKAYFGETTRHGVARRVADQFPELRPWLPPPRKTWSREDPRMSVFRAVAAGVVAFPAAHRPRR